MARVLDRQKAIILRKKGKTYSEIRRVLKTPKSTLSGWLSNFPLTEKQLARIEKNKKKNKFIAIEKTRTIKQKKREARISDVYHKEISRLLPLTKKELEVAGLFLYWGEGKKNLKSAVAINNTDPQVVKFALYWMINALHVSRNKIKIELHLYSDMNLEKEISFWSKELNMPKGQFYRPYIKNSTRAEIDQKGFGHGTCGVIVNDVRLKEKIMMGIKAFADKYSNEI